MRGKFVGLTAVLAASIVLGVTLLGNASETGQKDGDMKRPNVAAKCAEAERLGMGLSLAQYGQKNKSPEALLLAAIIVAESPIPEASKDATCKPKDGSGKPMDRVKTADELIAAAMKLDGVDELKSLVKKAKQAAAAKPRSPVQGFQSFQGYFNDITNTGDSYIVNCVGGQWTTAQVICFPIDNNCDLDLEIYDDQSGQLIASDRRPDMNAMVSWFAPNTRAYRIRVVNYKHTIGQLSRCNYALSVY